MELMSDEIWQKIHKEIGNDIMDIVMDFQAGRVSAGDTMDRIALHCDYAYTEGTIKPNNTHLSHGLALMVTPK